MPSPHADYNEFLERSRTLLVGAGGLDGTYYRTTGPKYLAPSDIISGEGARKAGGRWTPPGAFAAVYASTTPETATTERFARNRRAGIPDGKALPMVMVALRVPGGTGSGSDAPSVRRSLRVSLASLHEVNWVQEQDAGREALTQAVGRAAFEAGYQAIVVPSRPAPGGVNVVVFPGRLSAACRLSVENPDVLNALVRQTGRR